MALFTKHKTDTLESEDSPGIGPLSGLPSRPDIYPGSARSWHADIAPSLPLQQSRRIVRRKVSPFTVVLVLLGASVVIVLYISNIIAVGQLLGEINSLEKQHRRVLMEQEILKAQINKLASLERIQEIAEMDFGLSTPKEPPVWLNLDQERLKKILRESKNP